jgi:methyl-accepting chemotaxis protein
MKSIPQNEVRTNMIFGKVETDIEQSRRMMQTITKLCIGVASVNIPIFLILSLITWQPLFWSIAGVTIVATAGYSFSYWLSLGKHLTFSIYLNILLGFSTVTVGLLLLDVSQIAFFYLIISILTLSRLGARAGAIFTTGVVITSSLSSLWRGGIIFSEAGKTATDSFTLWFNIIINALIIFSLYAVMVFLNENLLRASKQARIKSEQLEQALVGLEQRLKEAEISQKVLSAATELSATASQLTSGAIQQVEAITEVNLSLEELNLTAGQIAQAALEVDKRTALMLVGAEQVLQTSTQAAETGIEGQLSVNVTVKTVNEVGDLYEDLNTKLLSVSSSAANIRNLVTILKVFADETHLLALNASIESAGAGEYGVRFGVVAHEVKGLANRSLSAAREAGQIIADLEKSLEESLVVVGQGKSSIQEASLMAQESGEVIDNLAKVTGKAAKETSSIAGLIKEVKLMAEEIGLITQHQQLSSKQILGVLKDVTVAARQTSVSSTQLSNASQNLENLSMNLRNTLTYTH